MKHLSLLKKLHETFGKEWLLIEEPETLWYMFKSLGIDVDEKTGDLINALKTLILSSMPWIDPFVFENIVDALNEDTVLPTTITKPPIENIMYAVRIMTDIDPGEEFSPDVKKYIASVAMDSQMVYLPRPLTFVNEFICPDDMGLQTTLLKTMTSFPQLPSFSPETPLNIQVRRILNVTNKFEEKLNK